MLEQFKRKYIGNRAFYTMFLMIAVPIMIQNGITNFVNMLDNIMVGQLGTEQMSGVSIVNQLLFVYNLCIYGGLSGAGIFTSQYYGTKNHENIRHAFRFKLWMSLALTLGTILLFLGCGESMIQMYLNGSNDGGNLAAALDYGRQYLRIMLWGLPPFMILQIYASTLRECAETIVPMKAGLIAVGINLIFNYLLIYGKLGFPRLGIAGAAIATVISRYAEAAFVVVWAHRYPERNPFITGIFSTLKVPMKLAGLYFKKGIPLLVNETMWAAGIAMLAQCYSSRGLNVVAGLNISNTLNNVFNVVFLALGNSVGIIVGQLLGADKMDEARDTDRKMIVFSSLCCSFVAIIMLLIAPVFPQIYNTTTEARALAARFIMIQALFMPSIACMHACYFTLRSGGQILVTLLFDSFYTWAVNIPVAFVLSHFTALPAVYILTAVQFTDMIKTFIGLILVKKDIWVQNIAQ